MLHLKGKNSCLNHLDSSISPPPDLFQTFVSNSFPTTHPAVGQSNEEDDQNFAPDADHIAAARSRSAPAAPRSPACGNVINSDIRLEKNLASLGFFTPSSKRTKQSKAKTVVFTRFAGDRRIEARATIVPAALYGLPVTSDQDKYLALQKIVTDLKLQRGQVSNPVGFTSAQVLGLLGAHRHSGKNYSEIAEWLDLMTSTTIISEEAVYLAGRRKFVRDRFKVFERAVSVGEEVEPGRVADRNYVWFSEWQLENLNSDYVIPVDFESYRRLKNHVAKTLVPLLQIWLYASRAEGRFEKRYDELCQLLHLRRYDHRSKIIEKLAPSLDELRAHGYLESWAVESTSDGHSYKIILSHGWRFSRGRSSIPRAVKPINSSGGAPSYPRAEEQGEAVPQEAGNDAPRGPLPELMGRGIAAGRARQILSSVAAGQDVALQLAWGDHLLRSAPAGTYRNPAGFFVHLLESNVSPPSDFADAFAKRTASVAAPVRQMCEAESGGRQITDVDAGGPDLDRLVDALGDDKRLRLAAEARAAFFASHPYAADWPQAVLDHLLAGALRSAIESHVRGAGTPPSTGPDDPARR